MAYGDGFPWLIGRSPRSGFAPRPAISAGAGSRPAGKSSRSRWGAGASGPTSAKAMAGPRGARSGRFGCGGAPTAIRGRQPFCRFAPSGRKTPGAKIRQAGITTSRCGCTRARRRPAHARRPALRFHCRDRPQQHAACRGPRQRGVPASGARQFRTDRRLRIDDEIGDAAFAEAARTGDENCD